MNILATQIRLNVVVAVMVVMAVVYIAYIATAGKKCPNPNSISASKEKKFEPRTQLGDEIKLLDPYSIPDDVSVKCVTLASTTNKEKICTYPTSTDNHISKQLNKGVVWEQHIIKLMQGVLNKPENKDMGLIDIGTNLGVFAITAASMGHPVVGVEPFPPTIVRLAKTLRLNPHLLPKIRILSNATSDKYETMVFWARNGDVHPGATRTYNLAVTKDAIHHQLVGMQVEAIRTDDLLHFVDFKRAILKVDIEDGEYKALNSAFQMFATLDITHVFMEWYDKYKIANERRFFIQFFKSRGYTVHKVDPPGFPQLELSEEACRHWPFDVVFIKQ